MAPPRPFVATALFAAALGLSGCVRTVDLRVENVSTQPYTAVHVGGQAFGDLAPGATSAYRPVRFRGGYVSLEFWAEGHKVTGQTWTRALSPVTYRLDVRDPARSRLAIEIVRD